MAQRLQRQIAWVDARPCLVKMGWPYGSSMWPPNAKSRRAKLNRDTVRNNASDSISMSSSIRKDMRIGAAMRFDHAAGKAACAPAGAT
jgi:hypothetical protein